MITQLTPIPEFLGLITHVDPSQVSLGGAIKCKNMAQLSPGRLRRIPGVTAATSPSIEAQTQIPLAFLARGLGASGADQLIAIFVGAATVSVVNLSTGLAMSGPALAAAAFGKPWTAAFYRNKWMFAGGDNTAVYQLDSASAYSAVAFTGSPPSGGNLIRSYLDKLYIADVPSDPNGTGVVYFTDTLSLNIAGTNLVNVKEIEGKVLALGVNSPTTDSSGIRTQLIIGKRVATWKYDVSVPEKDVVSQVVGFANSNVLANTQAGLVGLGRKGTNLSVFWLPVGSEGEPIDVGEPLNDIFNGATKLVNEHLAHAVEHGRFYKLFFSLTGQNNNPNEVWLDTYLLATEKKVVWYGVHGRGGFDASAIADTALELFSRGAAGANKRYQENASADSGFTANDGSTLSAELDLPLNMEPLNAEKAFEIVELNIAKEANISGNQVSVEPVGEGTSQGTQSVSVFDGKSQGISRAILPLHAAGYAGMTARDARIKITHTLNQRLDILGGSVQYQYHEGKDKVRKTQ